MPQQIDRFVLVAHYLQLPYALGCDGLQQFRHLTPCRHCVVHSYPCGVVLERIDNVCF